MQPVVANPKDQKRKNAQLPNSHRLFQSSSEKGHVYIKRTAQCHKNQASTINAVDLLRIVREELQLISSNNTFEFPPPKTTEINSQYDLSAKNAIKALPSDKSVTDIRF